jgi:hypothetical protein
MSSVGAVIDRKDRPAYVRFERRPIEDRNETIKQGRFVTKDVDYALVTPPYSKDCVEYEVKDWLNNVEKNARDGRIPQDWRDQWFSAYDKWKKGEELPVNGTAIKGWGVISPAQQSNLISIGVPTVEDLAAINDEGLRRFGMGGLELRDKARAWLKAVEERGPLTLKLTAMESENKALHQTVETQSAQIAQLRAQLSVLQPNGAVSLVEQESIQASDILEEKEEPAPRRSKARI